MKNKVHLSSIVFLAFLGTGLKAQTPADTLISRAHFVEAKPSFFLQAGVMGNTIRRTTTEQAIYPGFSAGISIRKDLSEYTHILLMVNYQHKYFENIKTTVYEPIISSNLQLTTSAYFDEIECPIVFVYSFEKLDLGAGLAPSYLIHSVLRQNVTGNFGNYSSYIKEQYNKYDNPNTAYFYLTNVSPCFYANFPLFQRFNLTYLFSFELISNPIEPYSSIQPYRFIQNKLSLTFKLNSNEKINLH